MKRSLIVAGIVLFFAAMLLGGEMFFAKKNATCPLCNYKFHIKEHKGWEQVAAWVKCPNCRGSNPELTFLNHECIVPNNPPKKRLLEQPQIFQAEIQPQQKLCKSCGIAILIENKSALCNECWKKDHFSKMTPEGKEKIELDEAKGKAMDGVHKQLIKQHEEEERMSAARKKLDDAKLKKQRGEDPFGDKIPQPNGMGGGI